jgi:SPX domain protein involved in polyphosphate accumulation
MVEYRYELKYVIDKVDAEMLKRQLKAVMELDKNSISEEYSYDIRSLYFDNAYSSSWLEKVDGIEYRGKYRIRIYNLSDSVIKLECKHKDVDMTYKESCSISRKTTDALCQGKYINVVTNKPFLNKFLANANIQQLRPSIIVDYRRTAFTYPISDVRITFDENICSGRYNTDLFDKEMITYPIMDPDKQVVLEVKCNEFIPQHILDILHSVSKLRVAVSKFAYCRAWK